MALFRYTAVTLQGQRITGELEAPSRHLVLNQIETLGYMPVHIEEASDGSGRKPRWFLSSGRRIPTPAKVTDMTRELAMLLAAGLPLTDTLRHVARNTRNPAIAALAGRVRKRLNDGQSLGAALEAEEPVFPSSYCSMVRVAEESGTLPSVLERIAQSREQTEKLRARVRSALIYPAFLIVTAIGAILVMLLIVVPRFKQLLATVDGTGSGAMSQMIGLSEWISAHQASLLAGIAFFILMLLIVTRQSWFKALVSRLAFKIPFVGDVLRARCSGIFCRTLSTLLENGVQLAPALELTAEVMGSGSTGIAVREAHEALRGGRSFVTPLEDSNLFAPSVTELLEVSLAGGTLSSTARQLADRLESDLELRLQRFFTILEPAIIILVSVFVAAVIMTILNAVLSVNDLVS